MDEEWRTHVFADVQFRLILCSMRRRFFEFACRIVTIDGIEEKDRKGIQ